MDNGIGPTLRDARNRRKLSFEQVESATKIRLRFLRAMENEEWDVLPGGAYSRAFLRTYANYLGLDGDRLVEDFRRATSATEGAAPRVERAGGQGAERARPGRAIGIAAAVLLAGAVLAVVLIDEDVGGGGGGGASQSGTAAQRTRDSRTGDAPSARASRPEQISLELVASAEVWVCLLDAGGEPLVGGQILQAGESEGPYRSRGFSVAFGNGEVAMRIDGEEEEIPSSSSPVGYEIAADGELTPLAEGERPSCT